MIVCRILKNKEATLTGASSCISMWLVWVRKETRRLFGFVGRGLKSGTVSVALFLKVYLWILCLTRPISQVAFVALQCRLKPQEKAWLRTYCCQLLALEHPERIGLSRFESVVDSNPSVKATVSEAIIRIYYWFGYEVGVYIGAIRQGLDERKLTLLASVRLVLEQQRCRKACWCISHDLFVQGKYVR